MKNHECPHKNVEWMEKTCSAAAEQKFNYEKPTRHFGVKSELGNYNMVSSRWLGCIKSRAGKGQSISKDRRIRKPSYKNHCGMPAANRNLLVSYPQWPLFHQFTLFYHSRLWTRTLHLQHIYLMTCSDSSVGRACQIMLKILELFFFFIPNNSVIIPKKSYIIPKQSRIILEDS